MKIRAAIVNNRKAQIELVVRSGKIYPVPFAKLVPRPSSKDRIEQAYVDKELGNEAVTYILASGAEGTVHIDHALEYNQDPGMLAELLAHKLTVEAGRRAERSGLSRRELARRLHTSVPQLYRLLDPTNTRKSLSQLIALLCLLDCTVDLVVKSPRLRDSGGDKQLVGHAGHVLVVGVVGQPDEVGARLLGLAEQHAGGVDGHG